MPLASVKSIIAESVNPTMHFITILVPLKPEISVLITGHSAVDLEAALNDKAGPQF
jgi:hypothetical protein